MITITVVLEIVIVAIRYLNNALPVMLRGRG